jgi:hypothetical protein
MLAAHFSFLWATRHPEAPAGGPAAKPNKEILCNVYPRLLVQQSPLHSTQDYKAALKQVGMELCAEDNECTGCYSELLSLKVSICLVGKAAQ